MDSESAKAETSVFKNCPHIRFGNLTFLVAVELNSGQISNSVSAISYPALEMWDLSEEDLFKDVAKQEIDDIVSSAKYSLTQYNIPEVMKNRISLIKSKSSDETCILHPDFCNKVGLMLGLNKFWVVLIPDLKGLFIGHINDYRTCPYKYSALYL